MRRTAWAPRNRSSRTSNSCASAATLRLWRGDELLDKFVWDVFVMRRSCIAQVICVLRISLEMCGEGCEVSGSTISFSSLGEGNRRNKKPEIVLAHFLGGYWNCRSQSSCKRSKQHIQRMTILDIFLYTNRRASNLNLNVNGIRLSKPLHFS